MEYYSKEVYNALSSYDNIAIGTHVNPDGDAVGSSLAMAMSINMLGKKPILLIGDYSNKFDFIKGQEFICYQNTGEIKPDVFISLDCGDKERLGEFAEVFDNAKVKINIDHHISNTNFGDINIVDTNASSSSEIVFEILKFFINVNSDIAEALYTGILTDTGAFKHSCTRARTLQIAGELVDTGIDFSWIQEKVLYSHSKPQVKVFKKALDNLSYDDNIAYTTLSIDEISECCADYTDLDGIVGYILNIDDVDVSVFLYQKPDGSVKISMRSKNVDVNKVASKFNGGGHKLAAGANYNGSINDAKVNVINEIKEELKVNE